ncbi:MAG TPA: lantibiotic dehydratase [Chitinophaga sp.]|uniref:lantibiotic dehydratase n=1 Tax=Chitinophaga sp. TaxID=1869181 RepID=UPI002DB918A3|nr:lantibiotic dehydratase [Chitinophaga sp.]HEU4555006.1 lantibiotic dehydratase [Chitinophaga sp.]
MNYAFFPTLVMRNPIFSCHDYSSLKSEELLRNGFFRTALYMASIDLYRELEKRDFNYNNLSTGQKNSLRKYYNRACFRPTPFGAFSSVTTARWSEQDEAVSFPEENIYPRLKLDFLSGLELCEQLIKEEAGLIMRYRANTSLYKVSRHFRYIKYDADMQRLKRTFFVVSLVESDVINDIVAFCSKGRTFGEIGQFLVERTGYDEEAVDHFVMQLISEQIVLPEWGNSITGNGCLEDLLKHLAGHNVRSARLDKIEAMLHALNNMDVNTFYSVPEYRQHLDELLEGAENRKHAFYAVTERGDTAGGIPMKYQQMIVEGLYCLDRLVPFYQNEELESFRQAFAAKFESQEIPLLVALDPEVGIGYENQDDVIYGEDALLKDVQFNDPKEREKYLKWTAAHSMLLNKLHRQQNDYSAYQVVLTEKDLAEITPQRSDHQLPPSISVVFRLHNGLLYLENAGGASAASLIGRFSAFNDRFQDMAAAIAEKEQEQNPEVLFAEIAHICDMHAANINRRKHIRKYEVPVIVISTLEEDRQLALSDLYISVRDNRIILRSKKHDAIVVPRLSTAFNYHNSALSVFRFLCDLQYQGLKSGFKLELEHFFPGLRFYPRVMYKSTILSLATWHLKADDFSFMKTTGPAQLYDRFCQLAEQIKLPRYFALTQHDNQLVFDKDRPEEVLLFLDAVKHSDNLTLTEFLLNEDGRPDVTDSRGKPLIGQYTAALYLNETVYQFPASHKFKEAASGNRNFAPGTEWVYFKIYCHPILANELLCTILMPFLEWIYDRKIIDKWFYIRYNDPDHHIRLRLHSVNGPSDMLMALCSQQLRTLLDEQKIEKYHIDTYVRELERYAPATIEDVESFFFSSSLLTISYMDKSARDDTPYSYNLDFIMLSMEEILNAFGLTLKQRISLFYNLYTGFYREFGEDKDLKKSLEKKYADLRQEMNRIYEDLDVLKSGLNMHCARLHEHCGIIAGKVGHEPPPVIEKLLGDMIHMHLNRLFVQNPRRQELIIYWLLYKHYNSMLYRSQLAR